MDGLRVNQDLLHGTRQSNAKISLNCEIMIARLARMYVGILLAIDLLLVFLSVVLSIDALLGAERFYGIFGKFVFFSAFGLLLPVSFLMKDRNVWKNEFSVCPGWLKFVIVAFMIYGGAVTCVQLIFLAGSPDVESNILSGSSLPLAFEAMPLGILYFLLWSGSVNDTELTNRVRNSAIALILGVACVLALRFGYMPQR